MLLYIFPIHLFTMPPPRTDFSIHPPRENFEVLMTFSKNRANREGLLSNSKPYNVVKAYCAFMPNELYLKEGCIHACTLQQLQNVAIQMVTSLEFKGYTRHEIVEFIVNFTEVLDSKPTFKTVSVQTNTFGEEARRILNYIKYFITTQWRHVDHAMIKHFLV